MCFIDVPCFRGIFNTEFDDVTVARDMLTKRMATGHRYSTLKNFTVDKPIR